MFSIFYLEAFMPVRYVVTEAISSEVFLLSLIFHFSLIGWSSIHPVDLIQGFQTDQSVPSYAHLLVAYDYCYCSGILVLCG